MAASDKLRVGIVGASASRGFYCEWPHGRNTDEAARMLDAITRASETG